MIGKLSGRMGGMTVDGLLLIEVGGVGYVVRTTPATGVATPVGAPLELHIHTAVRDDAIDLYGFQTGEELAFFKLLMSVSGVGPKTALGIISVADVPSLARAIARGDAATLTRLWGLGKKSAERIVLELKDKILPEHREQGTKMGEATPDIELIEALEALGYSLAESRRAVRSVPANIEGTEKRLAAALKELGGAAASRPAR